MPSKPPAAGPRKGSRGFHPSSLRNVVGEAIRLARTEKNVTQVALAARLEILGLRLTQSQLAEIEAGSRSVWDYELVFLAKALGIPTIALIQHAEETVRKALKAR